MERALLPEGRAAAAPRPTALAAAAPLPTVLATVSALGRLLLPSLGFKASAWIGKAVALRCLGALPAPEKRYALAAYGLADVACSCMGRTAYYCATDALTTFAAQAYGARQHAAVGAAAQRAFAVILVGLYLPVVVLWCFARPILVALGQPHEVASRAAAYGGARTRLLVFALANAVLLRSLNAIRRPLPAVLANTLSAAIAAPLGWLLIVRLDLGVLGAAYDASALEASAFVVYIVGALCGRESRRCFGRPTWRALRGWRGYLRVALPAFAMLMLEQLAWETLEFPTGLCAPSPEAALSAYAILYNMIYLLEAPGIGLNGGAGAVVGNALGAGQPLAARRAAHCALAVAIAAASATTLALYVAARHADLFGWYRADDASTALARSLLPELCACVFAANLSWPLLGIVAGAGRQSASWPAVTLGYFGIGIPTGAVLAFARPGYGFRGLFQGAVLGLSLSALLNLLLIVGHPLVPCAIDWAAAAAAAKSRLEADAHVEPAAAAAEASASATASEEAPPAPINEAGRSCTPLLSPVGGNANRFRHGHGPA